MKSILRAALILLTAPALVGAFLLTTSGRLEPVAEEHTLAVAAECRADRPYRHCRPTVTPPPSSTASGSTPSPTPTVGLAATAGPTSTVSPNPTVSPTSTVGPLTCPPFPAFPDARCTGWRHTGVTLRDCSGDIQTDNVVLDGCRFRSSLKVAARNVTVKRSHVRGVVFASWLTDWDFLGLTLIDVEIDGRDSAFEPDRAAIGASSNYTCIRCHVHHTATGMHMGSNVRIVDSYSHDFTYTEGAHQSAAGAGGGELENIELIHNRFDCSRWNVPPGPQGCSAALALYDEPSLDNVLVKNNVFNTAGGYCTYGGGPRGANIRYIDNRFGKRYHPTCGGYGPVAAFYSRNEGNVWTGNRWLDGSGPVNP